MNNTFKNALGWFFRKCLSLLGASVLTALLFVMMGPLWGSPLLTIDSLQDGLAVVFFAAYLGAIPALVVTSLSDLISPRFGKSRLRVALLFHLAGVVVLMLMLKGFSSTWHSDDWLLLLLSLAAVLTFFFLDEGIKRRFKQQF